MSLIEFCNAPAVATNPLPDVADRRVRYEHGFPTRGAWPVDALPFDRITTDLDALGVTFQSGVGYARDGARIAPDDVAFLVADVLATAAEALPEPARVRAARMMHDARDAIGTSRLDVLAAFDADPDLYDAVPDGFRVHLSGASTFATQLLARARTLAAEADPAEHDWRPYAAALHATADDLRGSAPARRKVLNRVRPLLSAPSRPSADALAALSFLASLDGRDVVRRSELSALYVEAGSPGAVAPADLRELATGRWGAPRKTAGHFVYTPSASSPDPVPAPAESPAVEAAALPADLSGAAVRERGLNDAIAALHEYNLTHA